MNTFSSSENERLAAFSTAVRESTLKRLRQVPEGRENHRLSADSMSIADIAAHILEADLWLFEKMNNSELPPMTGRAGTTGEIDHSAFEALIDRLETAGCRRAEIITGLDADGLGRILPDSRFGGETALWWIILRGTLDHEIHHRGQIALLLTSIA